MAERLDVIIFGATGFTGKHTVYEAVQVLKDFKWEIAGRNKEKLNGVLREMGEKSKTDLTNIPTIIADISDEKSLKEMAEKCKILVNCCGPYRFYGEAVVKACIQAGTHHVDVSGEPQYMETMQLKYNDLAKENGVYVISACGFDSIPADLGTVFLENHFDGVVNSVETYLETWEAGGATGGCAVNYGTWESAVYGLAHADELRGIRAKLFESRLPQLQPRLKNRSIIHKSAIINSYCLPFPGSDRSVVMRSQRIMYENEKKRPIQMKAYVGFRSLIVTLGVAVFAAIFGILTRFSFGRNLLLKYPKIFSAGMFSHEGPSEEKTEKTRFSMTFYGEGWPKEEKLAEPTDQYKTTPSKTIITKVTGKNPGYGATCVALLVSAVTVLKENDKMPGNGGVLPPGAAFAKTNMINELRKYENGMQFDVVSIKEKSVE
ncbi:saccharopine dehydrogenase-like oxidoreductase [Condylostylus longicornis]|uniref:saccharopine dehydrogenase-like oxidoreductase n=1 Tax=Condylostylus longicornis TaxID=2530218 RepID=UPI00244E55B1|nr:saccharopine dehydrogenase-like oxidoreductase [Condylostylus longicornis]XP_055373746.1 saccharopine dehydrogenase-like oxidoreductase [Condylostylus longicornis]XP_055373747.1 saccharopine dehydrogenase-like oxidoreductase [Condylostylus longicornis]XP_055373748.1 saccharopine dehydrogenase-like oxidoreductase [Condylostylus longicornis]XP_055373749.1 saccharopine dehydrogenase-like oxidoreductase [Condylostylus longicornis]XP_055373750.1 saccharopine dehydrogenase-like oxidoreductase [Co